MTVPKSPTHAGFMVKKIMSVSFLWNFFISRVASTAERSGVKTICIWAHLVQGHICSSPSLPPPPPLSTRQNARSALISSPSHPLPPPHWIMDRFWQPCQKSRMASILESVSMIAEFGHQQWSCRNFRRSDRTLRSRDRILSFHRNWWKFARPPRFWTPAWILTDRAGTTSRYSMGETPPIKAEWSELDSHLGSTFLRGSISTRIWTRALQPDQEEVSSWRLCRAQIVSGRQTFTQIFWLGAEIFTRRGDFNARQGPIVRLYFYQAPIFCIPA